MVWIDTQRLESLGHTLYATREDIIGKTLGGPPPAHYGDPLLDAACSGFADTFREARMTQAGEVTALADGAVNASNAWAEAEAALAGVTPAG